MENKIPSKVVRGPGGIKCSCCRVGSMRYAKTKHHRILRRRMKVFLRNVEVA